MNYLYLNNTRFEWYCNFADSLWRPQTKEISFQFFVGSSPDPSSEKVKGKDISLVVGRAIASSEARKTPMRTQKYKATTRSARWDHFFSKWVRAKVSISSQIATSSEDSTKAGCVADAPEKAKPPRAILALAKVEGGH
jgi:hypothetical protein